MGSAYSYLSFICVFEIVYDIGFLFIILFIPYVNIILLVITAFKLAHAFGRGEGFAFGLLLIPLVFYCIWPMQKKWSIRGIAENTLFNEQLILISIIEMHDYLRFK